MPGANYLCQWNTGEWSGVGIQCTDLLRSAGRTAHHNNGWDNAEGPIEFWDGRTSSPSRFNLGAETYARLRMRSWVGLVTCDSTTVSPERTDLTRASKGMIQHRYQPVAEDDRKRKTETDGWRSFGGETWPVFLWGKAVWPHCATNGATIQGFNYRATAEHSIYRKI